MKFGLYKAIGCLLILFNIIYLPVTAEADQDGKAVVVFIDRIGLQDIIDADTPNIDALIDIGSIGLMTTNTGGSYSQKDAYVTLGAGTRAIGAVKSPLGFNVDEAYQGTKAGLLFEQITGLNTSGTTVVNLGIAQTVRNNISKPYQVKVGALGTALRDGGLKAMAIGNCDTPSDYNRFLSSFLMDDRGIIPEGYVDRSHLIEDHSRPFGLRTDYNALYNLVFKGWNGADLIAIQLGDTSRAEDFRYEATDAMNLYYKKTALEESDEFLGRIIDLMDLEKDLLMIVSPLGSARDLSLNNRMTTVIIAGKGYENGALTSASTKRTGIITNLDIGATLLGYFDLPHQPGQLGSPAYAANKEITTNELLSFNARLVQIFNQRSFILRSYVIAQVIVLILALLAILFKRCFLKYIQFFLTFLMAVPLSYLLIPLLHQPALAATFVIAWSLALVITIALYLLDLSALTRIMVLSLTTGISLLLDQVTGASLIQGSPLGYDVISGARFYGIGNEYMGILIGAVCTGAGVLLDINQSRKGKSALWFILPLLTITLFIMAHPGIGANVGGAIAAFAGFAAFMILVRHQRIKLKHIVYSGIAGVVFIFALFIFDSLRPIKDQSHMGQTASLIRQNGLIEMVYIVKRKVSMNIKLFRYTIWTRVFLLSLVSVITLIFRPMGVFRDITAKYPGTVKGLTAATIGSIAAFIFNDSGIVAASTAMVFIAPPIILLVIDELQQVEKTTDKEGTMV